MEIFKKRKMLWGRWESSVARRQFKELSAWISKYHVDFFAALAFGGVMWTLTGSVVWPWYIGFVVLSFGNKNPIFKQWSLRIIATSAFLFFFMLTALLVVGLILLALAGHSAQEVTFGLVRIATFSRTEGVGFGFDLHGGVNVLLAISVATMTVAHVLLARFAREKTDKFYYKLNNPK